MFLDLTAEPSPLIFRYVAKYRKMDQFLSIVRALSDRSRVRALLALTNQQLCVCQIMELLGFAPSTVSKHMTILKQAGLVKSQKRGRWVYYSLPGNEASELVRETLEWLNHSLGQTTQVSNDIKRIRGIVQLDPTLLGRRTIQQER